MIKSLTSILTVFALILILSCCKRTNNDKKTEQETPKALQEEKLAIKSYSRSNSNLMEELYAELVEKSSKLKDIENDLDALRIKPKKQSEEFETYDSKSTSYYNSLDYKVTAIKDSLLRMKIQTLIKTSKNQYKYKTAGLNSLLKLISQNSTTLNDHHIVLKIVLTLPLIEKYQNDNLPGKKELMDLIKEQEKLIKRIDSLTPKF